MVLLVAFAWRIASLFDPPWVNDEGTYFAVGQAMAHGYRLYSSVWENKPPLLYLLYTAVYHLTGPSLLAVRTVATGTALLLVLLTYLLARLWADEWAATLSAVLAGLLLGVPFLEGTTANAELFLAMASAAAVFCVLRWHRASMGGGLMAVAIFFKVVAGFDALALALLLYRDRRRDLPRYVAGLSAVTLVMLIGAALAGILPAMLRDAFLYDVGYVGRMNGSSIPWLLVIKLLLLTAFSWRLRRAPFPVLWLLYALTGALLSGRLFGHYLIQCVAPACLCLAILLDRKTSLSRRIAILLTPLFVAFALLSALAGSLMAASGHDSILARRLSWYPNFVRYATGQETAASYRNGIDDHVTRNIRVAAEIRRLPPGKLLVWGNSPWIYVLSGRLPATPYTSSLRDPAVPGETNVLRRAVQDVIAREVVVVQPAQPGLGSAASALRRDYDKVSTIANVAVYISASGIRARR